jgi:hypothetical protein
MSSKFTGESIIPALDTLIERAAKWEEQFVMGMALWPFEYFGKYIWQIYTRYFRRIEGKD